jgi:hypothetical protein
MAKKKGNWDYRGKRGVFGTDSERYVASMSLMKKHPDNNRRPDLISINGRYKPRLRLEVKSGAGRKMSLVDYQLHYGVSTGEDYFEMFGEEMPVPEEVLPGMDWLERGDKVAYYYNFIERHDGIGCEDLKKPFSAVQLDWSDQFIMPHELVFYSFAVNWGVRLHNTGKGSLDDIPDLIEYLRDRVKRDLLEQTSHYGEQRGEKNMCWQSYFSRDAEAIFYNDSNAATEQGKQRIENLRTFYPELDSLRRIKIAGPNGTVIHVLSEDDKQHYHLFNTQMRRVISERIPVLERIQEAREEFRGVLGKIKYGGRKNYSGGGFPEDERKAKGIGLSLEEVKLGNQLTSWVEPDLEFLVSDDESMSQEELENLRIAEEDDIPV